MGKLDKNKLIKLTFKISRKQTGKTDCVRVRKKFRNSREKKKVIQKEEEGGGLKENRLLKKKKTAENEAFSFSCQVKSL